MQYPFRILTDPYLSSSTSLLLAQGPNLNAKCIPKHSPAKLKLYRASYIKYRNKVFIIPLSQENVMGSGYEAKSIQVFITVWATHELVSELITLQTVFSLTVPNLHTGSGVVNFAAQAPRFAQLYVSNPVGYLHILYYMNRFIRLPII